MDQKKGRRENGSELCGRCAYLLADAFTVTKLPGRRDCKVTCSNCGKRRFGGFYKVEPNKSKK